MIREENIKLKCKWLALLLCWAIEEFSASEKQTALVTKASDLVSEIEKFEVKQ